MNTLLENHSDEIALIADEIHQPDVVLVTRQIQEAMAWYANFLFELIYRFNGYEDYGTTIQRSWNEFIRFEVFPFIVDKGLGAPFLARFYAPYVSPELQQQFSQPPFQHNDYSHNPFLNSFQDFQLLEAIIQDMVTNLELELID